MKIAYLTQSYPPMISGVALIVQHLAQGMIARGHEILVITASDRGRSYLTQEPELKIVRLSSTPNPSRANQHFVAWAYKDIRDELASFAPDVIHLHDALSMGLAGIRAGKKLGIPLALTTHQLPWFVSIYLPDLPGLRNGVENFLWQYCRWLKCQTHQFISPTPTIASVVEEKAGFRPVVISNGMDIDRFNPHSLVPSKRVHHCQRFGLDPERPIILHVGRLDTDKQVHLVVLAAAKAIHNSEAQLLVVGDGRQKKQLIRLAHWCGIDKRCHFSGFIQPEDGLPDIYRMASVFITASEIETQGLVLLEAMASGLPVIAPRATCIPEIIHHGVNGYLVPPKDIESMAERLVDALRDPVRSRNMGLEGRRLAEQHASPYMLDQYEALYQTLCK